MLLFLFGPNPIKHLAKIIILLGHSHQTLWNFGCKFQCKLSNPYVYY